LMSDDRNRSIRLTVRNGEVELTAQSAEEGEGSEVVPADYTGEEVTLGFNWQYLQDFLNVASAGENGVSASAADADTAAETAPAAASAAAAGSPEGNTVRVKEGRGPVRVSFEFKDANAQTQMRIAGETSYDYKYIVMPLRI